jgi:hypothetical protein
MDEAKTPTTEGTAGDEVGRIVVVENPKPVDWVPNSTNPGHKKEKVWLANTLTAQVLP